MLNIIYKCTADSKARLSSCIICLLFMTFSPPNSLHCGKACTHVKHLAEIILHWHKFSKVRKTTRKSNKAMALSHKDMVFVEEILCFYYLTKSLGGGSWKSSNQWGDLPFRDGHPLSQLLTIPGRLRVIRTDVFLWNHMSSIMSLDNSKRS